jgi:hypothetical protein
MDLGAFSAKLHEIRSGASIVSIPFFHLQIQALAERYGFRLFRQLRESSVVFSPRTSCLSQFTLFKSSLDVLEKAVVA